MSMTSLASESKVPSFFQLVICGFDLLWRFWCSWGPVFWHSIFPRHFMYQCAWEENMISKDRSAPPIALDETSHDKKSWGERLCMLKDGLGSGTLSAPEVILMRLTEAGARHKKVWNQISKQRSYPTPFAAKFYSLAHVICAGKCWQLIWGPSFTVQFGSGKTWQQLVSITFVGQPVAQTSPNIVDFWGEGNKDGIEMLGNISNVFFGGHHETSVNVFVMLCALF